MYIRIFKTVKISKACLSLPDCGRGGAALAVVDAVMEVGVEVEQDLRRGRRLEIVAAGGGGAPEGGLGRRHGHRHHGLVQGPLGPVDYEIDVWLWAIDGP